MHRPAPPPLSRRPRRARGSFFAVPPARRLAVLGAAALCPAVLSGCNLFMIAAYLIAGPPSVEPHFEAATRTSLTDEDVVVAVACYVPTDLRGEMGNENLDRDVARAVAQRLTVNKIVVRDPDQVRAWLARNPDWEDGAEIAEAMQVTHVVYIDVSRFTIWEENSADLMRGRMEALVTVWAALEEGDMAEEIYGTEVVTRYPLAVPRSTSSQSPDRFRREFLLRLSEEVGRLFYPHWNGDDMTDAV